MAAPKAHVRAAVDANVYESIRLAAPVVGALEAFFVIVDLLVTPPQWATQVAFGDLALAGICFTVAYAIRTGRLKARHAHATGALVAGAIALDVLHDTYVLGDPQQTTYLILVVVGAGSIFLSARWLYVLVGGSLVGWVAVAAARPEINWTTFGFALFAACVLGVLIHAVRSNTFERMESLRFQETGRKEQLEIREQAIESAVQALQDSEERYKRLVEGAPDAFLVISGQRILFVNPAAVRMFAASSAQQLLGIDALKLVHPDYASLVEKRTAAVESGQASEPVEIKCVRLDGSVFDVEVVGQPITYLGQPADQTVVRDITDRKRAEAERAVAGQRLAEISRLKEMDRVKTQFVNTISHELRTPLTPIKVQLHILKGSKTMESMQKASEVLDRNVGRLSSLVDELLEVARIQAGTLKLAKTYVDISASVSHTLESYVDVAKQNGIELVTKIEPDINVLADPKRLQQVMYNLLSNAFKFTEKGGRIAVEVSAADGNATVRVADSGAGLEKDEIERLFEPFSQVHDTMEKTNAGTGLGLYICRGIIEGHGGRIWAESRGRGKGATFSYSIPLA